MGYRVIQWATGGLGCAAIQGIVNHPELELAGCWVHSADKAGRDAGEIAGIGPIGVAASDDIDEILATEADCVLYSPLLATPSEVVSLLESGKNVVTPLGWFYPVPGDDTAVMEAACSTGGTTLHGTGIHPGGITERFPLMISALSGSITHVRAEEFSDIRTYDAPAVVGDVMLFGHTPDQAAQSPMLDILGGGFMQSVNMLADTLGFAVDAEKRTLHEMAVATRPIDSPIGPIQPGRVAAQRFTWQATVNGTPVITARVNWLMGEENLDPDWNFGPEGERFEIAIDGDPPVQTVFHGLHPDSIESGLARNRGIVATAMHNVNAIPAVCRADPGVKTYLDLPIATGKAAPSLARG